MTYSLISEGPRARIYQIGRGDGIAVSIKTYDGWQTKQEWIDRDSAIAHHTELAAKMDRHSSAHFQAVDIMTGRQIYTGQS